MATVKDFIYLDTDRLNSLYSQVFQGIVEAIVETELNEEEGTNAQRGGILASGGLVEQRVAAASYKTHNRILYDHMFNLLEQKLSPGITDVTNATIADYRVRVSDSLLIRVRGMAELWDFRRLKSVFDNLNDIGLALTYITTYGTSNREMLEKLKAQLEEYIRQNTRAARNKQDPELDKKREAVEEIDRQLDVVERAKASNLYLDAQFLKHISYLTDMFYSDFLEIVVQPKDGSPNLRFRGICDSQWFRQSPDLLRMLNAGHYPSNWTMVGQVTFVPKPSETSSAATPLITPPESKGEDQKTDETGQAQEATDPNDKSQSTQISETDPAQPGALRDAYRQLVKVYHNLEGTFTEGQSIIEVVVHPLAIFREANIPDSAT